MRYRFPQTLRPYPKNQQVDTQLPFCPTQLPSERVFKGVSFHFFVSELNWLVYSELIRAEFLAKVTYTTIFNNYYLLTTISSNSTNSYVSGI